MLFAAVLTVVLYFSAFLKRVSRLTVPVTVSCQADAEYWSRQTNATPAIVVLIFFSCVTYLSPSLDISFLIFTVV